jgi:hypothetical protein
MGRQLEIKPLLQYSDFSLLTENEKIFNKIQRGQKTYPIGHEIFENLNFYKIFVKFSFCKARKR